MAGVGKLLKQAKKMQERMTAIQEELANQTFEISAAGGAVKVVINGQNEVKGLTIDPEFLKEDAEIVQDTLLAAVQEALAKSKQANEEAMSGATAGFNFPGMM